MLVHHRRENKIFNTKYYDSESVVYQTKNAERGVQERDRDETSFKHLQTTKMLMTLNNVMDANLPWIFYIANQRNTHFVIDRILTI